MTAGKGISGRDSIRIRRLICGNEKFLTENRSCRSARSVQAALERLRTQGKASILVADWPEMYRRYRTGRLYCARKQRTWFPALRIWTPVLSCSPATIRNWRTILQNRQESPGCVQSCCRKKRCRISRSCRKKTIRSA